MTEPDMPKRRIPMTRSQHDDVSYALFGASEIIDRAFQKLSDGHHLTAKVIDLFLAAAGHSGRGPIAKLRFALEQLAYDDGFNGIEIHAYRGPKS